MAHSAIHPIAVGGADADSVQKVFYASDYGAVFDGISGTDNTTAINAALTAAAAWNPGSSNIHGAIVQLPAGNAKMTGQLVVKDGVWLRGCGPGATELYWNSSMSSSLILVDSTNQAARVSDLAAYSASGTTNSHGIEVESGVAWAGEFGGIVTEVEHVIVKATGHGVSLAGVENRLLDVYAAHCGLAGFYVTGTDSLLSNCTADTCGQDTSYAGFQLNTSNTKLVNCKAFGCTGSGFNIGAGQRNMLSCCEAQDNALYGFNDGGDNVYAACIADTNGQGGGTMYGFYLNGSSAAVGCLAVNRYGSTQTYGYMGVLSGNSTLPAIVGCTSRLPGTADVAPGSVGLTLVNTPLPAYTPTNVSTDRAFDADTVLVAELADVVGTLIADLQAVGVIA